MVLIEAAFLVLLAIAFAAVVRAVVRPADDRFAYLRFGMDEIRLIGLGILFTMAFFVAEMIAAIPLVIVSIVAAMVVGQGAVVVVAAILFLALFCAAAYVQVRLSLAGALTVMRRRIVIRDAWRVTRGQFWRLFGVYVVLTIAFTVGVIVVIAVTNPSLLGAYASLDPLALNAAAQEQMAGQGTGLSVGMVAQLIAGSILGTVMGAVAIGAVATAAFELDRAAVPDEQADSG